jgi:hypothetical protein
VRFSVPLDAVGRGSLPKRSLGVFRIGAGTPEEIVMRMKKQATIALAGTASLIAGLTLWPSAASADGDSGPPSHGEVLEGSFVSSRIEETFVDHDGDTLPSLGDQLIYTNSSTGTFGDSTDYGSCLFHQVDLTADSATLNCTQTSEGADFSLTTQGTARVGLTSPVLLEKADWAITGGTGTFSGAEGEVRITRFEGDGPNFKSFGTLRIVLDR